MKNNNKNHPKKKPCPNCRNLVDPIELIPEPDPLASELYNDNTPVVQCDHYCKRESAADI